MLRNSPREYVIICFLDTFVTYSHWRPIHSNDGQGRILWRNFTWFSEISHVGFLPHTCPSSRTAAITFYYA